MEMEKQRGISITTSVMQFPYHDCLVNLLDTRGTELLRRYLPYPDGGGLLSDGERRRKKIVEDRTRKLMEFTRLRDTPILTFIRQTRP